MPEFLRLQAPDAALSAWLQEFPNKRLPEEELDTSQALNRIASESVISRESIPAFPRSTMDGYAVRARDTYGASENLPAFFRIIGEVPMGRVTDFAIGIGQAVLIHTGGMVPSGADAVLMLEHGQRTSQGDLEVYRAVAVAENIIQIGEDVSENQTVISIGTKLQAVEIGSLMALGQTRVRVFKKPVIGILSSGDEVIDPALEPLPGQIRDINSFSISACVENYGGEPVRLGIIPDDEQVLEEAISSALCQSDAVVISAGSSASVRDYTSQAINAMGEPGVIVHGVNTKPGKPTILAICDGKPIVGLPGNPISALVIARFFIKAMIEHLLGMNVLPFEPSISAKLSVNLSSQSGREDWWPVRLIQSEDGVIADPIFFKSSLIFTFLDAQGLIKIPADANGLAANTIVEVYGL